jgi:hypothetical protein
MTVTDLLTHLIVIAGLSDISVMCVEILSIAKHGVGVTNIRLAETAAAHSLMNLLWRVKAPLAKTSNKLRPKPSHIASDGKISFNPADHGNAGYDTQRSEPATPRR